MIVHVGGGKSHALSSRAALLALIGLLLIAVSAIAQPTDNLDYRSLNPRIWVDDFAAAPLDGNQRWGSWPLHFTALRAQMVTEDDRYIDVDAINAYNTPDGQYPVDLYNIPLATLNYRHHGVRYDYCLKNEVAFEHTSDPACLVVYQVSDTEIALRWQPDRRYIELIDGYQYPDSDEPLSGYQIYRDDGTGEVLVGSATLQTIHGDPVGVFMDTVPSVAADYTYRVRSIDGDEVLDFSRPVGISFTPGAPQNTNIYMVQRVLGDHPDPTNGLSETHHLQVHLWLLVRDGGAPPTIDCLVRKPTQNLGDDATVITMVASDVGNGEWLYSLPDGAADDSEPAHAPDCRGHYTVWFQRHDDGAPLLDGKRFTSCSNNRIRSKVWFTYTMDIDTQEFRDAVFETYNDAQATHGSGFRGIRGDAVTWGLPEGVNSEPDDYIGASDYAERMADFCNYVKQQILNSENTEEYLVINAVANDEVNGGDQPPYYAESDGVMFESYIAHDQPYCGQDEQGQDVVKDDGDTYTGPNWLKDQEVCQWIVQTPVDYVLCLPKMKVTNAPGRLYTYASFLLSVAENRDTTTKILYGMDPWKKDGSYQVITAEQTLPLGEPLETIELPDAPPGTPFPKSLDLNSVNRPAFSGGSVT